MSCCMRDAVALEALGIPTVILVNDVFESIAHATAALLELPANYLAGNIVWLPHPTSNITRDAAEALIDERIAEIRAALLGRVSEPMASAVLPLDATEVLAGARARIEGLANSLRADGADLVLNSFVGGILEGELRTEGVTCEDGSCILPAEQLAKMIEALVRPNIPTLRRVVLHENGAPSLV